MMSKFHAPVKTECAVAVACSDLTTLAYNVKRVLNLVSLAKLMAAVGVKVMQTI